MPLCERPPLLWTLAVLSMPEEELKGSLVLITF